MKTMPVVLAAVSLAAEISLATVPELHDVSFVQDPISREVVIDFGLSGEPAVVTVDVLTNGTSIGYAHMRGFVGALYRVVQPTGQGERHHVSWRPDIYWPEGGRIADGSVQFVLTAWSTNAPPEWLVADLKTTKRVYFYPDPELFPEGPELTNNVYKTDYLIMRKIHAAGKTYIMGVPGSTTEGAKPQRTVAFTRDFYISIFNLTAGQWNRIVDNSTGDLASNVDKRKPRVSINWPSMTNCAAKASGFFADNFAPKFSLVTSAQWEYACRAGTTSARYFADDEIGDYVWYSVNAGVLQEVGTRKPNPWMLYDMIGNVNEYTADTYVDLSYSTEPILDPSFTGEGKKVYRGGAYNEAASYQASYTAGGYAYSGANVSFRLGWTLP